ncbi:MAG TPA: site-specific integrase [Candidatus Limiplasma sp.]|nr:site-specific integrase [Candidatus Limiplasma sp.]
MKKRQMRFLTMGMENKPTKINIDITEEEAEQYDEVMRQVKENNAAGRASDYNISRIQLKMVGKYFTPFGRIGDIFIEAQKGRGNAALTIKHYEGTIRKLKKFFAWLSDEKGAYEKQTKEEQMEVGGAQPYAIFETDNFESSFREFLLDEEGVSEQTVATYFRDYRAIAYYLMDEGLIEKRNITVKSVEADIKDCYNEAEIERLLRRPKDDCSFAEYRSWVVVNYVLATGNRVSTIVSLKIKDIDLVENMVSVNTQKNKRKMRIPLEPKLRKILKDYIDEWLTDDDGNYITDVLFPSSFSFSVNQPMSRASMGHAISEYNKSRNVSKTSIHLFRHTFAKNWIIKGGDLHSLQKVLGHSTLEMVTHYANLYDADLRPKVESFSVLATHKTKNSGKMIKRRTKR